MPGKSGWIGPKRSLASGGVYPQYRTLESQFERWAVEQGITCIQAIKPMQLARWYSSRDWTRLASRSQRWGILRSVFSPWSVLRLLKENPILAIKEDRPQKDHVQRPYAEGQVTALMASVKDAIPTSIAVREKKVYFERLTAYFTLLLNVGCDLVDAVLHEPERIADEKVGDRVISVYRYKRKKTGVDAVIPLHSKIAALIRTPWMLEPGEDKIIADRLSEILRSGLVTS